MTFTQYFEHAKSSFEGFRLLLLWHLISLLLEESCYLRTFEVAPNDSAVRFEFDNTLVEIIPPKCHLQGVCTVIQVSVRRSSHGPKCVIIKPQSQFFSVPIMMGSLSCIYVNTGSKYLLKFIKKLFWRLTDKSHGSSNRALHQIKRHKSASLVSK